ncbi:MAG: nuclear transport factor 2 family protein, partial [Sphingopyxis sp.]|nr:nuclear transport factor 2 family protein [Sphingopyxis sp.]
MARSNDCAHKIRGTSAVADFQTQKAVVRAHYVALAKATPETAAAVLAERTSPDWLWRGMHPFHEQNGAAAVAAAFWAPFLGAMHRVQRRQDIFFAGLNEIDDFQSVWVVSMGHLMGLFDAPFLGIRPTGRIAMMRYAEFNRVEGDRIVETALFCDIPQLMLQAGQYPFPP